MATNCKISEEEINEVVAYCPVVKDYIAACRDKSYLRAIADNLNAGYNLSIMLEYPKCVPYLIKYAPADIIDMFSKNHVNVEECMNDSDGTHVDHSHAIVRTVIKTLGLDINSFILDKDMKLDRDYFNINVLLAIAACNNTDYIKFRKYKDNVLLIQDVIKDEAAGVYLLDVCEQMYPYEMNLSNYHNFYQMISDRYRRRYMIPDSYSEIMDNWMYIQNEGHLRNVMRAYDYDLEVTSRWLSLEPAELSKEVDVAVFSTSIEELEEQYKGWNTPYCVGSILNGFQYGVDIRPYLKNNISEIGNVITIILRDYPILTPMLHDIPHCVQVQDILVSEFITTVEKIAIFRESGLSCSDYGEISSSLSHAISKGIISREAFSYENLRRIQDELAVYCNS